MTDVDQFEFQAKYTRYLSTQQRVSDWVNGAGSQTQSSRKSSESGSRHITKSSSTHHNSRSSVRRYKDAGCVAVTTTIARQQQRAKIADLEPQIISPTIALILSSLFISIILPSLLTISAFALLLTYTGSLEVHVCLSILPLVFLIFNNRQDSRDESIPEPTSIRQTISNDAK